MRAKNILCAIFLGLILLVLSSCLGMCIPLINCSLYLPISLPENYKNLELTMVSTEISSLNYIVYNYDSIITNSDFNTLYPNETISNCDSLLVFDNYGSMDFSKQFYCTLKLFNEDDSGISYSFYLEFQKPESDPYNFDITVNNNSSEVINGFCTYTIKYYL